MMEAAKIRLLSVDNSRSAIMVHVSVVITLVDDDGFVTVLMITVADDVTITITVPVTISVTLTNRYANRTDTDPHLASSSRHCAENSGDGGDHYGILNHCVLLSFVKLCEGNASTARSFRLGLKRRDDALAHVPTAKLGASRRSILKRHTAHSECR
jgi:hypothetical protein